MTSGIDVGRLVAGKYELVRLLGKGAMGEVWLATHNSLGGEFAIKLVEPGVDQDDSCAAGRFQLEAQISAKLSRKTRHIVSVSDHGEEDGLAYLVMERLEGASLEERIDRAGGLSLDETVAICMQVARALGYAHAEGIFHRDLKPANLFLTKDEDGRLLVKLLDFGIARGSAAFRTRSPVATGKDMVLGTPSYMSPEQARGLDTLDHRCDLWALAVVAYESLTGELPWEGETIEDIFLSICTHRMTPIVGRRPDLPRSVHEVFARSFAPELDHRFRTAAELSDALEALVDPQAVEAAMGSAPRAPPSSARRPAMASDHAFAPGHPPDASTDLNGIAVGRPTAIVVRGTRSSAWLIAAVAVLLASGAILVGLRSFSSRGAAVTATPSGPQADAVPTNLVPPPAAPVVPTTARQAAPSATATTTATTKGAARTAKGTKPPPAVGAPVPPPPVVAVTAPPPVVAAPPLLTTTPTPPPRVPDKSGVF